MKEKWNERFSSEEYVYGKEPNNFLKEELQKLPVGNILFLAEGEGRNGVFAAAQGWAVDAVDFSESGKRKAEKLAAEKHTKINYTVNDLMQYNPLKNYYDAVGIFYLHLNEESRKVIFNIAINALKPGGRILFEAFDKEQLKFNSGGPKDDELLFSLEEIVTDFIDLEFEKLTKEKVILNEGKGHQGEGMVIRFVGRKSE